MLEIHDEHPQDAPKSRFYFDFQRLVTERRAEVAGAADGSQIETMYMADFHGRVVDAADRFIAAAHADVILDISSMPKRFFFPILRRLMKSQSTLNVIVTYSIPQQYDNYPLAEEPGPKTYLPTFLPPDPEPPDGLLVFGLGYEPLGLRPVIKGKECVLLFPYPSLSSGVRRNWDMVRMLEYQTKQPPFRVYIYDVPSIFNRLSALTNGGTRYVTLAPYGPKTMSLAMCLFGIAFGSDSTGPSAFYTQPKLYNPNYSSGVATDGDVAKIHAYLVKSNGRCLFEAA